jgi:hypothetical protein
MPTLADLHRAVAATLTEQRIGQPVFVRFTVAASATPQAGLSKLAVLTEAVRHWVGQTPEQIYTVGTLDSGHVSLAVQFRQGATALVSLVRRLPGEGLADLVVLGNHGAIYHEAGPDSWNEEEAERATDPALRGVIERALASGKIESVQAAAKR